MIDQLIKYAPSIPTRTAIAALPAPVVDSLAYCQETNTLYKFSVGLTTSPDGRRVISPTQVGDENAGRWVEVNPGVYTSTHTATPSTTGITEDTNVLDVTEFISSGVYGIYVGIQAHFETESTWAYVLHNALCRNGNWTTVGTPTTAFTGPALTAVPTFSVGLTAVGTRTYVSVSCIYDPMATSFDAYPVYAAFAYNVRLW